MAESADRAMNISCSWPDSIDDRKKVIWFRNDVFEHAFHEEQLSAYTRALKLIMNHLGNH